MSTKHISFEVITSSVEAKEWLPEAENKIVIIVCVIKPPLVTDDVICPFIKAM